LYLVVSLPLDKNQFEFQINNNLLTFDAGAQYCDNFVTVTKSGISKHLSA
jgi:hypothetical protein